MCNGRQTVLCIDDDPDILDALHVFLESGGYDMLAATSAREGIQTFRKNSPDLVIVDMMMETFEAGADFVKAVRSDGSSVPIYMLTMVGDILSQTIDCSKLGLDGILQKPIDPIPLLAILSTRLKTPAMTNECFVR